jgi:hypothetical protein
MRPGPDNEDNLWRGIGVGIVLSVPMWVGIYYLMKWIWR